MTVSISTFTPRCALRSNVAYMRIYTVFSMQPHRRFHVHSDINFTVEICAFMEVCYHWELWGTYIVKQRRHKLTFIKGVASSLRLVRVTGGWLQLSSRLAASQVGWVRWEVTASALVSRCRSRRLNNFYVDGRNRKCEKALARTYIPLRSAIVRWKSSREWEDLDETYHCLSLLRGNENCTIHQNPWNRDQLPRFNSTMSKEKISCYGSNLGSGETCKISRPSEKHSRMLLNTLFYIVPY